MFPSLNRKNFFASAVWIPDYVLVLITKFPQTDEGIEPSSHSQPPPFRSIRADPSWSPVHPAADWGREKQKKTKNDDLCEQVTISVTKQGPSLYRWYIYIYIYIYIWHLPLTGQWHAVPYRGGWVLGCSNPHPPEIPKDLQNRVKLNPICENC